MSTRLLAVLLFCLAGCIPPRCRDLYEQYGVNSPQYRACDSALASEIACGYANGVPCHKNEYGNFVPEYTPPAKPTPRTCHTTCTSFMGDLDCNQVCQ